MWSPTSQENKEHQEKNEASRIVLRCTYPDIFQKTVIGHLEHERDHENFLVKLGKHMMRENVMN